MLSVKVSTKNQISVPSEARKRLGIVAGDRLAVEIRGEELVLRRRPARASERLRGLGAGVFGDPATYLRELHAEWEDPRDGTRGAGSAGGTSTHRPGRERADRAPRGSDTAR